MDVLPDLTGYLVRGMALWSGCLSIDLTHPASTVSVLLRLQGIVAFEDAGIQSKPVTHARVQSGSTYPVMISRKEGRPEIATYAELLLFNDSTKKPPAFRAVFREYVIERTGTVG